MRLVQWKGSGYRVTSSEDKFFSSALHETTLFHMSTPYFEIEPHSGEFSIKLVLQGEEGYIFSRRKVTLRQGSVLLVNAGETYASLICSPSESLSIFFCRDEVHEAATCVGQTAEEILDMPDKSATIPEVAQIAFAGSPMFYNRLATTISAVNLRDISTAKECVRYLLLDALGSSWNVAPPCVLQKVRRRTTRDELLTRIYRARTLIDDTFGVDVDLDRLAQEACISRYHFLRVFAEVTGETPVAYARRRRFERAKLEMDRGEDPLWIALLVGYKDLRTFLRAYRNFMQRNITIPTGSDHRNSNK